MNVVLRPSTVSGSVTIPPSKSQSHRAIIAASLAPGKSTISNIAYSDDVIATIGAMEKIGAKFVKLPHQLHVTGVRRLAVTDDNFIDCNESGSTLRFILPIFSLVKDKVVFTGKKSLFKRPMNLYENLWKKQGLHYQATEDTILTQGTLTPGNYEIPGNVSSQFISGLLFTLPLLKADSTLQVVGDFESRQYVDMTIETLAQFHIKIHVDDQTFRIPGNQTYHPTNVTVEGDFSQLAFFAVMGILGGSVLCKNVPFQTHQPDRKMLDFIRDMGGVYEVKEQGILFRKSNTVGCSLDVSQCPDIAPVLSVLAACSEGKSQIVNAARLKMKESNRLATTAEMIQKLGGVCDMGEDSLSIQGVPSFQGGTFESHHDHRIVMSVAAASVRAKENIVIHGAEAVNKSYPNFFQDLASLGVQVLIKGE